MIVNKYELANKSLDEYYAEIASRTRRHKENPPHIVFTIGTARSGTTASLNVFRGSIVEDETGFTHKIPANYQVFKAGLRHAMLGWKENSDWNFQFPKEPLFYMKDTIGPYTEKESQYNPLKVLEYMEYPTDKIFVVFSFRDPLSSLFEWIDKWGEIIPREVLASNFILAANTLSEIKKDVKARGLAHTTLLYETIRDNSPKDSARVLFDQINQTIEKRSGIKILPTETTTENWDRLDEKWCNPNQPYIYELPQIDIRLHRDVRTKTNWEFQEQTSDQLAMIISSGELKRLEDSGLYQIYEEFRREAERNPGLQTKMLNSYKNVKEIFAKKSLK